MPELTPHQLREVAQQLAALLSSQSERDITRFKQQRLGASRAVEIAQLSLLRGVLAELAGILLSDDAPGWTRLEAARAALQDEAVEAEPEAAPAQEARTEAAEAERPPSVGKPARIDAPEEHAPDESAVALPLLDKRPYVSPWMRAAAPPAPQKQPAQMPPIPAMPPAAAPQPPLATAVPFATAAPLPTAVPLTEPEGLQVTVVATEEAAPTAPLPFHTPDEATREFGYTSLSHALAMSVEEYAALCAERDHDPAAIKRIHARYAIQDNRCRNALDRLFHQLFVSFPAERDAWQHHYRHYAELLRDRAQ